MILSFKQKFPDGTPTYFIEKIWRGFFLHKIASGYTSADYDFMYREKFGAYWDGSILLDIPYMSLCRKLHTIRAGARWKPGDKIHFCINARTPNYFQFAPVVEVVSVQDVIIKNLFNDQHAVIIDGRQLQNDEINTLAINDGFPDVDGFWNWFRYEDFTGQIIHWTPLKY